MVSGTVTLAKGLPFGIPKSVKPGTSEETTLEVAMTAPSPIVTVRPGAVVITVLAPTKAFWPMTILPAPLVWASSTDRKQTCAPSWISTFSGYSFSR